MRWTWTDALLWTGAAASVYGVWRYFAAQTRCDGALLTRLQGEWRVTEVAPRNPWLMTEEEVLQLQEGDWIKVALTDSPDDPTGVVVSAAQVVRSDDGTLGLRTGCYLRTDRVGVPELIQVQGQPLVTDDDQRMVWSGMALRQNTPPDGVPLADV